MTDTDTRASESPSNPMMGVLRPSRGAVASRRAIVVTTAISIALIFAILVLDMPREVIGLCVVGLMLSLMFAGVPIAYSMIITSGIGLYAVGGWGVVRATLGDQLYSSSASWQLSVIPLFIAMGIALWRSGVSTKAYNAAFVWLGRLPGGLAVATNFSGAGMAAASGSSIGISMALGRMSIPEMLKAGYAPWLATGAVTMAGTLGQLIPPATLLVIYAGIAQVSVGEQLVAAIVPGVSLAILFALLIMAIAIIRPSVAPRSTVSIPFGQMLRALVGVLPLTFIIVIIIGGLGSGIMTATEAGAVGAIVAIVVGVFTVYRDSRSWKEVGTFISRVAIESAMSAGALFLVMVGVNALTKVIALTRVPAALSEFIVDLQLDRLLFLLALVVIYLILGMFIGPLEMMLLTLPIFMTPLIEFDISLVWFGVFLVILAEMGLVTPPVGMLTFIVHRLAQNKDVNLGIPISLGQVFKGVTPFLGVVVLVLVALILFPEFALWLPSLASAQ